MEGSGTTNIAPSDLNQAWSYPSGRVATNRFEFLQTAVSTFDTLLVVCDRDWTGGLAGRGLL